MRRAFKVLNLAEMTGNEIDNVKGLLWPFIILGFWEKYTFQMFSHGDENRKIMTKKETH